MSPWNDDDGQVLVESILGLSLVVVTCLGAAAALKSQWQRFQCAYLAFESAHAHLTHRFRPLIPPGVSLEIEEDDSRVVAWARCGKARERVRLFKLDTKGVPSEN